MSCPSAAFAISCGMYSGGELPSGLKVTTHSPRTSGQASRYAARSPGSRCTCTS